LLVSLKKSIEYGKTYSERSRSVASRSPASATVKSHTLIGNNLEETTATEGLGVRLALDLEHVEGKQDNFTDTDYTGGC
jgi:hypothetical protein